MSSKRFDTVRFVVKPVIFLLCLLPLGLLIYNFFTDNLSANPISDITNETGIWTLRFLVITLSITPLRKLTGWSPLQRLRRMVGLFAFLYVCLHFSTYIYLDKFFDWHEMLKDISKRPFITVGFTALILLTPLAMTSIDSVMRWMGGKQWRMLHRIVYVCSILGVIHYLWLVKADKQRPVIYGVIVILLLGYRLWVFIAGGARKNRQLGGQAVVTSGTKVLNSIPNR
jgi:methionine sulfoxide reductase heme-binding subunit